MDESTVAQTLGRIEATLGAVNDKIDVQAKVDADLHKLHLELAARVDKIERQNIKVGGIVAGVVFAMGLVGGVTLSSLSSLGQVIVKLGG